ncbi:MAG TPA: hypothetical protein VG318_14605 [Actinomycetota bacterium]|nr:hypothetical protein [Actinomycetota bacterium]
MRQRAKLGVSLVAVMAVGAYGLIGAQAAPQEFRPFDAVLAGTSTAQPPVMGESSVTGTGTIRGTHIGNGTYSINAVQDYERHEGEQEHPAGDCAFVEDNDSNGLVITAANGDQIFGNIDDDRSVVCVSEETAGPGADAAYLSTLYVDVTGGTGRFTDAHGWIFVRGESTFTGSSPIVPPFTFSDEAVALGTIDY